MNKLFSTSVVSTEVFLLWHEERKEKERKGKERKGKERKGKERKGKERKGKEKKALTKAYTTIFLDLLNVKTHDI
jgi:hypothetical protein